MAKGRKTGGRQAGTPNKKTQDLKAKAEALGVDPFEILLLVAKGDWKALGYDSPTLTYFTAAGIEAEKDRITLSDRLNAASEAVQYLEPKRKAVEHSGPGGGPIEHKNVSELTDEQLEEKISHLLGTKNQGA